MRTLNQQFEDKDFEKLEKAKRKSGKTWYDFIMSLTEKKQED